MHGAIGLYGWGSWNLGFNESHGFQLTGDQTGEGGRDDSAPRRLIQSARMTSSSEISWGGGAAIAWKEYDALTFSYRRAHVDEVRRRPRWRQLWLS